MLIELTVQNFRSISESQNLSMVAGRASAKRPWASLKTGNHMVPSALRSACLFGANGSGKSNVVKALAFLTDFVEHSAKDRQVDSIIDTQPFAYDAEWRESPTEIEVVFVHNGTLYQYGFIADQDRVYDEWLFENPPSKETRLRKIFSRSFDEGSDTYDWYLNKTHLRGERESWKNNTRDNALFLSTAVQLNSSDLRAPYEWLVDNLRVVEDASRLSQGFSVKQFLEDGCKEEIIALMNSADVPLEDLKIEVGKFDIDELPKELPKEAVEEFRRRYKDAQVIKNMETVRSDSNGAKITLDFEYESAGTQMLFKLAGPLLHTLRSGITLVIDELQNNLHPLALKYVVDLFASEKNNPNGAQLIFTSHEASILDDSCIHRDQVWFVEKHKNLSSHLFPLSSFKEREIASLQKAYLDGRFGGIPLINEIELQAIQADGEKARHPEGAKHEGSEAKAQEQQ
ncbi:AAA family ATPase [Ruegeria arenilitoris]|uniref:AAA family ATPase n=1 Tax=Ruegeria arenilitoris TaxID=1173585 RepID=UPI00147DC473|nr:ATP-binding protein [Ruegeria arenilitoris]